MHIITLIFAIVAAVLFAIGGSGRVEARSPWGNMIAWGLFFFVLAFIATWTLRGDDLIYFIE
jgi:hypothetical protein